MEMISKSLSQSLFENTSELRESERVRDEKKPSRLYLPNGSREVARRLRQMERKAARATQAV